MDAAHERATGEHLDYNIIYGGFADWRVLPAIDHPVEPARCSISGTGLTHLGSASDRQDMHVKEEELTDSMKMFLRRSGSRKARAGKNWNATGMVLQRYRSIASRTRRVSGNSGICGRWRRGSGDRGCLSDCSGWASVAIGNGSRERIFRSQI